MKRILILLQVIALVLMFIPATAKAQSKSDFNLDKFFKELKEMIENEMKSPDFDPEKLMEKLKEKIDNELKSFGDAIKKRFQKLFEEYLGDKTKEKPKKESENKIDFWLGISADNTKDNSGILVTRIIKDSPADKAGIKVDDKITSFGKHVIRDLESFKKILPNYKAGMRVGIGIKRGNELLVLTMTLAKKSEEKKEEPKPAEKPFMGVMVQNVNGRIIVTEVVKNGPADLAGIKPGDLIYMLGKKIIRDTNDLLGEISKHKVGDKVNVIVIRRNQRLVLTLTFKARPSENEIEKPYVKPYIGFSVEEREDGVYVTGLVENSPAAKADFKIGDKLHYFGEVKIMKLTDIKTAIEKYGAGTEVGCVVYRGKERVVLEMNLVSKEEWEKEQKPKPKRSNIWLGFSAIESKDASGVIVTKVVENGPADRIGLMPNDKIIVINNTKVVNKEVLRETIAKFELGAKVGIGFKRGNVTNGGFIKIMTKEEAEKLAPITRKRAWIGISLNTTYQGEGIQISVLEGGVAEQIGLKKDDVILSINGQTIKDRMHFAEIWKKIKPGSTLKLEVLRGEQKLNFEMPTFMQPNHEETPMPERPKVPEGWNLPQLPGGMTPEQYYAISNLSKLAIEAMQTADYDEAIKYLKKILEIDSNNFNAFYNLACIYSLQNKKKEGLEYLKLAIGTGFIDWEHIKTDTDLDNLRDMPEYKEMMANKKALLKLVADMKVKEIKAAYGEKFNFYVDIDNMLIISTEHPTEILEDVKDKLVKYAEAQWKLLFDHKPDYFITIIIPTPQTFNKIVTNRNVGGFYSHSTRSLIAKELGQTLIHEFTHALHYGDIQKNNFARQSIWFVEGLATCFENSVMKNDVPTPLHNGRLAHLQYLLNIKAKLPNLADFMARDRNAFLGNRQAGISYTLSRYITYWLWEQGLLKKYYDLYTEMLPKDPNGIKALEKLLEKPIDEIEKDWYKWVKKLPDYRSFTMDNRPYIGIKPTEEGGGIKIIEVLKDTPAFKAGFKSGDVLTHIDGERIISLNDLFNILMAHKPADEISITFVRDGKKKTIKLKLVTYPKEEEEKKEEQQTQPEKKEEKPETAPQK